MLFILGLPFNFAIAILFRILAPFFRKSRSFGKYPWVIGGHRGRIYEDNSAALHSYIFEHTKQPIIWIANSPKQMQGFPVLKRNSFKARLAILRAPVLIYSHGEDDLDLFLLFFRKTLGMRVYLGHSLSHLKISRYALPGFNKWTWIRRKVFAFLMTDFDLFPTSSIAEKKSLDKQFRFRTGRILSYGGGAHIDKMLALREEKQTNILTWFPTYRYKGVGQNYAYKVINNILKSDALHEYLEREDLHLSVVGHINSQKIQNEVLSLHSRISVHSAKEILPLLGSSVCFISDYSGLVLDWLCFGRPLILFPFDKDEYLKSRNLNISLEDIHYGPLVYTAEDFLKILTSEAWKNMEAYAEKRKHWMDVIFPDLHPGYSKRCYETIMKSYFENKKF